MSLPPFESDAAPLSDQHPLVQGRTSASPLITAYRGTRPEVTPVWFMRQAGRSLPEYRELRVGTKMLDACLDPELSSEITLQPVRRHGVDAAIFFSDIVVPLKLAGVAVDIVPGKGPVLESPVRTSADVDRLWGVDPASLGTADFAPVADGVAATVAGLAELHADGRSNGVETPLIGFAGAPFTLAAYMVEGGPSKDHIKARTMMHADPESWARLMQWTAAVTGLFLETQVRAGASAAQLFDSWAGALSLADYETHVAPASAAALTRIHALNAAGKGTGTSAEPAANRVPIVHFGVGTAELLPAMRDIGADVVGIDYRLSLDEGVRRLGGNTPVQGNIDPALLAAPWPVLEAHVLDVLERGKSAPSHVLNLGHGVPPETDPDVLTRLVSFVHGR